MQEAFSLSADNPNINLPRQIHLVKAFVLLATVPLSFTFSVISG